MVVKAGEFMQLERGLRLRAILNQAIRTEYIWRQRKSPLADRPKSSRKG